MKYRIEFESEEIKYCVNCPFIDCTASGRWRYNNELTVKPESCPLIKVEEEEE